MALQKSSAAIIVKAIKIRRVDVVIRFECSRQHVNDRRFPHRNAISQSDTSRHSGTMTGCGQLIGSVAECKAADLRDAAPR